MNPHTNLSSLPSHNHHNHHQPHGLPRRHPLPEDRQSTKLQPSILTSHLRQSQSQSQPSLVTKQREFVARLPTINSSLPKTRSRHPSKCPDTSSSESSAIKSMMIPPIVSPSHSHSSTTPTQSIPIHSSKKSGNGTALKRSTSELRLLEEEQQADLRDYIFFSRLVHGIAGRESDDDIQDGDHQEAPPGSYTFPQDDEREQRQRQRCSPWLQRQKDLCLAHIIGTRNGAWDNTNHTHRTLTSSLKQGSSYHNSYHNSYNHTNSLSYIDCYQYSHDAGADVVAGGQQPQQQASPHEDIFRMDW